MPGPGSVACPKPIQRKTLKGRKDQAESKQKHLVRMLCVARDGYCRMTGIGIGRMHDVTLGTMIYLECAGPSEWAHMHSRRRSQTRNQAPEIRHDSAHSLMLCAKHHQDYDQHRLRITSLTRKGADGPLKFARMQ